MTHLIWRSAPLLAMLALLVTAASSRGDDKSRSIPLSKWQSWLSGAFGGAGADSSPADGRRDPTQAQGELRRLLNTQPDRKENGRPTPPPVVIPALYVRGRVVAGDGSPVVLLTVGKDQTVSVRPGREYFLAGGNDQPITLKVLGVEPEGVEVEIQPLGKRLILP